MSTDLGPVSRPPSSCCVFVAALRAATPFRRRSYARRGGSSDRLDEHTLTVVSRGPNGSSMPVAHDMSAVRDAGLAVLPGLKRREGVEEWPRMQAQVARDERGNFDQFSDQFFDQFLAARQPAVLPLGERDRLFQELLQ